jgi:hypothetical protein
MVLVEMEVEIEECIGFRRVDASGERKRTFDLFD